jgi:hypothetical protein
MARELYILPRRSSGIASYATKDRLIFEGIGNINMGIFKGSDEGDLDTIHIQCPRLQTWLPTPPDINC